MAGNANTTQFMLSSATLMIGPLADLHNLNTVAHSLGLVKNVQFTADPQYVELTQGIRNSVVMSVRNADGLKISGEVYEFTAENIAYGAGLDGSDAAYSVSQTTWASKTSITAAATAIVVVGDISALIAVGDYLFLQKTESDYVHIVRCTAIAYSDPDTTITFTGWAIPTGMTFPVATRIGKVAKIEFGATTAQEAYAAKIVGLLPKDNTPFTIMLPKVKITRGLSISFATDNFTNMPFELTPYAMASDDAMYATYGDATAILFPR